MKQIGSIIILTVVCTFTLIAQHDSMAISRAVHAPIILEKDTLFFIYSNIGPFSPQERAAAINAKLDRIVRTAADKRDSLSIQDINGMSNIMLDSIVLMSITNIDAKNVSMSRSKLAQSLIQTLQERIDSVKKKYTLPNLLLDVAYALAALIASILLLWLMAKLFPRLYTLLDKLTKAVARLISMRSHHLITPEFISDTIIALAKGARLALTLLILYYWILYTLSLFPWTSGWNVRPLLKGILFSSVITLASLALVKGIHRISSSLAVRIPEWKGTLIHPVKFKNISLLTEDRIVEILLLVNKLFIFAGFILLGYFYVTLLFSFFEFTETWASALFSFISNPLVAAFSAFVGYLPNLFSALVIIGIMRYVIKFVHFIFGEIEKGTIAFSGFHRDWAEPTYKIARFLIFVFAAIVIFPYLPGSDSPFFQGISVFIGVLFSLGSTSAIANIVSGVVLTYMRPFKVGDRVKIADTMGDVIEKTLLVTRIRTIKNVDITVPNAMVLGSHIINFSSCAKLRGLILHTSITIGYTTPWKTVHQLLLSAAEATEKISKTPAPFVLQTSLNDYSVTYELNTYTEDPGSMAQIYSDLHRNIQDKFNETGIEIMSPHYTAVRDGNQTTVPESYLPKSYHAPAFRIFPFGGVSESDDKKE